MQSESPRFSFRKMKHPVHPMRRVPALTTAEAAAIVLRRIRAEQSAGFSLDQIDWQGYCRDSAVVQMVTQQLANSAPITEEV